MMIRKSIEQEIPQWLEPKLQSMGLFFVNARLQPGHKIQVFIDGLQNVTINQCAEVSRFLETFLDAPDAGMPENYNLEVSSPGMDNPLMVPQQYSKRIGRLLDIQLNNGEHFQAVLEAASAEGIRVMPQAEKKNSEALPGRELTYSEIKKCIVQFKF